MYTQGPPFSPYTCAWVRLYMHRDTRGPLVDGDDLPNDLRPSLLLLLGPRFPHHFPGSFASVHRVVIVIEDEVLHQIVLSDAGLTDRTVVAVGLPVALEGHAAFGRRQAGHRSHEGGNKEQPKQHQTAAKPGEKARTRGIGGELQVLRHSALGGVAEGAQIDGVGEIFPLEAQIDLHIVVLLVHLNGNQVAAVDVGDGGCPTEVIAVHFALRAFNIDVPKHHRRVVAVGG